MTRLKNDIDDAREQSAKLISKIRESKRGEKVEKQDHKKIEKQDHKKIEKQDHKKISKDPKHLRSPHGTLKPENQELTGIIQQHGGE